MTPQKPTDTIDHSDRLAYELALIITLTDLDPDGRWQEHELYQFRRQHRYGGLTVTQHNELLDHLEECRDQLTLEHYRNWLATRHQQAEDDAQTQSLEPTQTPMA